VSELVRATWLVQQLAGVGKCIYLRSNKVAELQGKELSMSWHLQQINNAGRQPSVPGEYVACPQATAAPALSLIFPSTAAAFC